MGPFVFNGLASLPSSLRVFPFIRKPSEDRGREQRLWKIAFSLYMVGLVVTDLDLVDLVFDNSRILATTTTAKAELWNMPNLIQPTQPMSTCRTLHLNQSRGEAGKEWAPHQLFHLRCIHCIRTYMNVPVKRIIIGDIDIRHIRGGRGLAQKMTIVPICCVNVTVTMGEMVTKA